MRYTYGKKALGLVKSKLQAILHENANLYIQSKFLEQDNLMQIYAEIKQSVVAN